MRDIIRVLLGRLIGAGVGAATGYAAAKGIARLDPACTDSVTRVITDAAMLAGYGVAHKLINRKVNPNDAAKA